MNVNKDFGGGVKDVEAVAEEPKVFARLTFDKGFKIVLGTEGRSEKILMSLLNRLFDFRIVDLQFLQTEKFGLTEEDAKSVFDVYCKDESGRRFLVEMQMWGQPHFDKRSMIYLSLAVMDQVREGKKRCKDMNKKWDYNFESVYVVSFLNQQNNISEDPNDPRVDPYISRYITRSIATGKVLNDGTNRVFIDLHRFRKTFDECTSDIERWLFSIKNMHMLEDSPIGVDGTELEDLYIESRLAAWDPKLRTLYERLMANELDREISMEYEMGLARAAGRAEGRAEGEIIKATQIAKNMLTKGMAVTDIADITGLSTKEIESL